MTANIIFDIYIFLCTENLKNSDLEAKAQNLPLKFDPLLYYTAA